MKKIMLTCSTVIGISAMTMHVEAAAPGGQLTRVLQAHVYKLAGEIGQRNLVDYAGLNRAADYINAQFKTYGLSPREQTFQMTPGGLKSKWDKTGYEKQVYRNVFVEIKGSAHPEKIVVIGAHYDSVAIKKGLCRAANDNASGVAATLALAKYFADKPQPKTLRFVAFANEEPPFFWTTGMGSDVYAKKCRADADNITGMLSLETMGCYSDRPGSQRYPLPGLSLIHPDKGNFIAFVGNTASRQLQKTCLETFRKNSDFPADGASLPMIVPRIGASDHFSFWRAGYQGIMVTDTAPYRDTAYHTDHDDPENLNYEKMAQVVEGLKSVVAKLAE